MPHEYHYGKGKTMPMNTAEELKTAILRMDHKGYPAYKSLAGSWRFPDYILNIDHVQGDPFASPSALSVQVAGASGLFFGPADTVIQMDHYLPYDITERAKAAVLEQDRNMSPDGAACAAPKEARSVTAV